ncbi:hypothetical protein EHQ46_11595 [Leptospira yanagawae]|uniref:Uncharacterized protein n=1 Tax=Leptospira yanagawae TaxID=293069 RepID=A0ABY2M091_9LEPT|nr:hypothetical protein EHQ46_11595 [Leptospira yanagawae]
MVNRIRMIEGVYNKCYVKHNRKIECEVKSILK